MTNKYIIICRIKQVKLNTQKCTKICNIRPILFAQSTLTLKYIYIHLYTHMHTRTCLYLHTYAHCPSHNPSPFSPITLAAVPAPTEGASFLSQVSVRLQKASSGCHIKTHHYSNRPGS